MLIKKYRNGLLQILNHNLTEKTLKIFPQFPFNPIGVPCSKLHQYILLKFGKLNIITFAMRFS